MRGAIAVLVLVACASRTSSHTAPMTDDEQLIARVRQAAGVPVERIEDVVATPAAIHLGSEALGRVELVVDPAFPREPFARDGAREVIYWVRPVEAHDPRVVGIIVRADGTSRVFFAIVLPP